MQPNGKMKNTNPTAVGVAKLKPESIKSLGFHPNFVGPPKPSKPLKPGSLQPAPGSPPAIHSAIIYNGRSLVSVNPVKTTQLLPTTPLPPPAKSPKQPPWVYESITRPIFLLRILTQGYGLPSLYAVIWKLSSAGSVSQLAHELQRVVYSRISIIKSAYKWNFDSLLNFEVLAPTLITPWIEQTEKGFSSYVIGSAMTQVVGPPCLSHMGFPGIGRMFHKQLIESAALCNFSVVITNHSGKNGTPDYIAYDKKGGVHLFEAKGGSEYRSTDLKDGADQLNAIASVDGISPQTKNVVMSFPIEGLRRFSTDKTLVTSVIQIPPGDVISNQSTKTGPPKGLNGAYLLGLSVFLDTLKIMVNSESIKDTHETFASYRLPIDEMDGESLIIFVDLQAEKILGRVLTIWEQSESPKILEQIGSMLPELDLLQNEYPRMSAQLKKSFSWVEGTWLGVSLEIARQ